MKKPNIFDLSLLTQVLSLESASGKEEKVKAFIDEWVKTNIPDAEYTSDKKGNLYVKKGDDEPYPTFVAHMDTVHSITKHKKVYVDKGIVWAMNTKTFEQIGTGGDDLVGVFIVLTMLKHFPAVKGAFFVEEETGCRGSTEADIDFFSDSRWVLQSDRRGNDDFVCTASGTSLNGSKFRKRIKQTLKDYNYKECYSGGLTDVVELRDNGLKVCSANIASGYYRPHFKDEVVDVEDVSHVVDLCLALTEVLGVETWKYKVSKKTYNTYGGYGGYDEYEYGLNGQHNRYHSMGMHNQGYGSNKTSTNYGKGETITYGSSPKHVDSLHNESESENYWWEEKNLSEHCVDCWTIVETDSNVFCDTCTDYYETHHGINPNQLYV